MSEFDYNFYSQFHKFQKKTFIIKIIWMSCKPTLFVKIKVLTDWCCGAFKVMMLVLGKFQSIISKGVKDYDCGYGNDW